MSVPGWMRPASTDLPVSAAPGNFDHEVLVQPPIDLADESQSWRRQRRDSGMRHTAREVLG